MNKLERLAAVLVGRVGASASATDQIATDQIVKESTVNMFANIISIWLHTSRSMKSRSHHRLNLLWNLGTRNSEFQTLVVFQHQLNHGILSQRRYPSFLTTRFVVLPGGRSTLRKRARLIFGTVKL
jgi:hypothetical protein